MPKKTKKQKIIAEYRRKLKLVELSKNLNNEFFNKKTESLSYKEKSEKKPIDEPKADLSMKNLFEVENHQSLLLKTFFYQDIKKSVITSLVIIFFIFLLYWFKPLSY